MACAFYKTSSVTNNVQMWCMACNQYWGAGSLLFLLLVSAVSPANFGCFIISRGPATLPGRLCPSKAAPWSIQSLGHCNLPGTLLTLGGPPIVLILCLLPCHHRPTLDASTLHPVPLAVGGAVDAPNAYRWTLSLSHWRHSCAPFHLLAFPRRLPLPED
jgi:hypothetical protein